MVSLLLLMAIAWGKALERCGLGWLEGLGSLLLLMAIAWGKALEKVWSGVA